MADIFNYEQKRKKIGARIRRLRKAAGLTQEGLAASLDEATSQNTISSWENGVTLPPLARLIALSSIFDCDISYLLCDYDKKQKDIADISDLTGLSEQSIIFIRRLNSEATGKGMVNALNFLLTCDNIDGVLCALAEYMEAEDLLQRLIYLRETKREKAIKNGTYQTNLGLADMISDSMEKSNLGEYKLSTQFGFVIQEVRRKVKEKIIGGVD